MSQDSYIIHPNFAMRFFFVVAVAVMSGSARAFGGEQTPQTTGSPDETPGCGTATPSHPCDDVACRCDVKIGFEGADCAVHGGGSDWAGCLAETNTAGDEVCQWVPESDASCVARAFTSIVYADGSAPRSQATQVLLASRV